jgi:uncharacterized protein (DUF302 family)
MSAEDGLITIASQHSVKDTIDRLEASLKAKGITVFARIDHAAGAKSVDMPLRPTELVIFGNPKAGTPLMQASQTIGLDLPLKALAWEDTDGKVWLTTSDMTWLARRYGLGVGTAGAVSGFATVLANLTAGAVAWSSRE